MLDQMVDDLGDILLGFQGVVGVLEVDNGFVERLGSWGARWGVGFFDSAKL